jgi:hypothetical protein
LLYIKKFLINKKKSIFILDYRKKMKRTLDTPKTNSSSTSNGEEGADTAGTTHEKIEWNDALEKLLCEEAEKCMGMAWMHNKSEVYFTIRNNWLQIPIIIISTITGAASVGSSSLFPGNTQAASVGVGGASILVSILGLINSAGSKSYL